MVVRLEPVRRPRFDLGQFVFGDIDLVPVQQPLGRFQFQVDLGCGRVKGPVEVFGQCAGDHTTDGRSTPPRVAVDHPFLGRVVQLRESLLDVLPHPHENLERLFGLLLAVDADDRVLALGGFPGGSQDVILVEGERRPARLGDLPLNLRRRDGLVRLVVLALDATERRPECFVDHVDAVLPFPPLAVSAQGRATPHRAEEPQAEELEVIFVVRRTEEKRHENAHPGSLVRSQTESTSVGCNQEHQ